MMFSSGDHVDYKYYVIYKLKDSSVLLPVWKRYAFNRIPSFDQLGRPEGLSRPDKSLWFVEEFVLDLDSAEEFKINPSISVRSDLIKPVYVVN